MAGVGVIVSIFVKVDAIVFFLAVDAHLIRALGFLGAIRQVIGLQVVVLDSNALEARHL